MLIQEREQLSEKLLMHFPKATAGDVELLWGQVKGLHLGEAMTAIERHRLENPKSYLADTRRIGIIAKGLHDVARQQSRDKFRTVDWIRQQDKTGAHLGTGDVPTITTFYGDCWDTLLEDATRDDFGRQMARAYILQACRTALRECQIADGDAVAIARDVVGLKGTETISGNKFFRSPPIEPSPRTPEALSRQAKYANEMAVA